MRVILLAAILVFWDLGGRPLYSPDEGRYGEIGRAMLESGDWIMPRLGGVPYLDKPPLLYWLEAAGMAGLGAGEWGARALPALGTLLAVLLCMRLGREMFDRETGTIAACILATSPLFLGVARALLTDGLLTATIAGAFLGFWRIAEGRPGALLFWGSLALSMLAKGPVGPALVAFAVVPFWLLCGREPRIRSFRPLLGPTLFVLVSAPWYLWMERAVPGYSGFFFLNQNLMGLVSPQVHHPAPWYRAWLMLAAGFLPWSLLLPGVLVPVWRTRDRATLLLLLWSATTIGLFTFSVSKLATYQLPAYPALALLLARGLRSGAGLRWSSVVFGALAGAALIAVPYALLRHPAWVALGLLPLAALVLVGGLVGVAVLLRRRQVMPATVGHLAVCALAIVIAAGEVHRFDAKRSPRSVLLEQRARLEGCEPLLAFRFPIGMAEFYLNRVPIQVGTPRHDYAPGRTLAGGPRDVSWLELPEFLDEHPFACVLTLEDKIERLRSHAGELEVLASDGRHAIAQRPRERRA